MHLLLPSMLLSLCWGCSQYTAAMCPHLLLPSLLVTCSDQQNNIGQQQEDKYQTTRPWDKNTERYYVRAAGFVSRIGKQQAELPSSLCCWYWRSTFVRSVIPQIVLGPNLARRDIYPPWDSNHITVQYVSPSCIIPACLHHNLSIEVFGQDVHFFLHWPSTLPIQEWQPLQLGWCACPNTFNWCHHNNNQWDSLIALLLPSSYHPDSLPFANWHNGEQHLMCTSYFNYHLMVRYTHQGLYVTSLDVKQESQVNLSQDLQVEPTLLLLFSSRSKMFSVRHKILLLSWRLLPVSSKKMDYRLMAVKGKGIWSTFYNPYALQNNYSAVPIPEYSRKKVVASIYFSTEGSGPGMLSGEVSYRNFTLSLTSKSELPTYLTFNTQKIKTGTYFFSRTHGLYYSTEAGNAANASGNLSNICYIFYQQQSLSYLITIESFQLHWYRFNINLYLNRKGALLRSFSQKDIEIHIFNSGPSFLQSLVYVVWFIPLQHPLLQHKWTFNLQFFDSRKEHPLQNSTYTYKDRVRNPARFIPHSALSFNPTLYAGFVAKTNCARSRYKYAILKTTVHSYASKVTKSTVTCLQRICFIKRVKIQKPDPANAVLNYSKREPFILSAVTQMDCPTPQQKDVIWKIYKVADVNRAPDWSNPFNPPGIGRRNLIMLEVPAFALDYGFYLFNFTIKLTITGTSERVEGSDSVFVEIAPCNLVAIIAGGNLQTVTFTSQWTLDGSASSDPDAAQPLEGLTFTWYCTKQKADYGSMILSENGKCRAEQVDLKWTASSDPVQTVQPQMLQENAVYYFRLVVRKGSCTAHAEQMVHVQPRPALNVTCIENCGTSVIPTERFCLSGKCLNCRKSSRLLYHWSLLSGSFTKKHFDLDSKTITGRGNSYICIKPLSFVNMMEQTYTLVLKMNTPQNESSAYNYSFFVNSPPLPGKCVLNPTKGMTLVTKYIVYCSGFKDKNLPLTYKVKAALDTLKISRMTSIENVTLGTIVYFGYQSKIPPSFLPVGIPSKQYALTVYVEVYDALGAYSQTTLQTTVYGPLKGQRTDAFLNELKDLISGPTAPITTFLKSGNYFRAAYFISIVASNLNDIAVLQQFHSSKTELREVLLNRSAEIPTTGVIVANQMISNILQITQEVTEVNRKSQLLAIKKLKEVTEELKKHGSKDLGSKEREILGTAILTGLSNVLRASLLVNKNIHRNGIKETIYMAEVLADLILQGKVPGDNDTIMAAKDWTITLRKNEKWDVSDASSRRRAGKNYFSSRMKQENNELPGDAVVSTVLFEFDNNPFPWLPYADDVSTIVTGFKMTGTKSNGDMIGIVPDIAEMIMTRKDEKANVIFEIMMRHDKKFPKATGEFSVEVLRESKNIFIQIVTKKKVTFQIFIYPGPKVSYPPIASFSVSYNKPSVPKGKYSSDCALTMPYTVCLSQTLLRSTFQSSRADKLNISVVLQSNLWAQDTQLVGIRLFTVECLYLGGVESHWKEGFCSLGPQTSWHKVHCICTGKRRIARTANPRLRKASRNDITFLAGKITEYSNPVDTEKIRSTQIHKNPVTLLTILFIFVVYIILAIWTMRKDKADMKSTDHAIVLPDNDPFDKVCYLVTIYTGSRFGAGTTADVFIQLIGERAISDVHHLRHSDYLTFFRGAINTFLVTSKNDLGDIYCFKAWHNNEGSSPNWFLSRIKVENIYTKKSWMFMCRKWFALDKDDGLIDRSFIVAHPKAPLNKMDFFLISFANDVADNHLWLSIFAHVCTGSLNRLQRLSCCLTILLCILLVNVMFFSTDKDQQMFSEHEQYLKPIIIGVQGAFISIPLQMIVTAFFKYSQEEPLVQNTTQTPPKECSVFMSGNLSNWKECLQKWYLIETASKGPGDYFQEIPFNASDSHKQEQSKKRRWGQTGKNWTNCTISEGDANVIATEDDMPEDANTNNNLNYNYLENHISYPERRPLSIANMVFCKRPQTKISWWNRYVLWTLVLFISTTSSFFIILYGLPFDYEESLEWLAASAISLWVNVFLLQTVNIGIFSALKTLYPKTCKSLQWSSKETYLEIKLSDIDMDADDMRELHYDLVRMRGTKQYHSLEEDEITIFKKRQKIQHQAFVFIKDVICHFVFLILILNIAYSMENTTSFYYNQDIHNKFSQGLSHVNKVENIYTWLRKVFLPLIHNDDQPTYLSETWSKILGLPRMRQVRAKNTKKECFYPHSFVNKFVISKSHCLHKYGLDKEDERDHLGSWTCPANESVSNNFTNISGFTYQSVTDPWKYSSYGERNTYGAGGYTFNFYSEEQLPNSTKRIDILERSSWLDENTWALIVEMTTFNSDVDLFCSISVVFEISHLGPINTTLWIHSYKLPIFKELSKREKFVYIAVGYILVFYIIDEFCVVERQRLKYIKTVSNLINFGIKGVCLFFLLQLAFKFKLASSLTELYLLQPDEFIPFHKVSHVDKTMRITLGFLAFLIVLKTLRYSRFFYDVRLAQRSILAALPGICSMALVVAVYFFVYMAFGYLVFGQYEWNYNTMTHSAQTVFSYCVSAFKDTAFTSNRVLGGLFLASFMMVMICVLINLFQAVIMSAYEDMKQPVYEEPSDEAEVVNFLFNKIRRIWFFITCRKASSADTELFNRVLFGHPERRNMHHLGLKARKINGRKMVYLVI